MEQIIYLISFFVTILATLVWIRFAKIHGITGKDMNKFNKPQIPEMGGIPILCGFTIGVLLLNNPVGFVVLLTTLGVGIVGLIDDKINLEQWQKPLLTIPFTIPMVLLLFNRGTMIFPLLGNVDFGVLFPLIIVPLGIIGSANGFNMLAGYNGLESGMGVIILSTLGVISLSMGNIWLADIAFVMVFALVAFLVFNWYPAKIFPGDVMTYSVGTLISCVAILGNLEWVAVVLFLPYFLDLLLPLRANLKVDAFAKPNRDGTIDMPYGDKIKHVYDITHLTIYALKKIKTKIYEVDVVISILLCEIVIATIICGCIS